MDYGKLSWRDADGAVQIWALREGLNTIGRDSPNDIVLPATDADTSHAQVICKDGVCRLRSIGNIKLNGNALPADATARLQYNDSFQIGATVVQYARTNDASIRPKPLADPKLPDKWEEGIWAVPPDIAGPGWMLKPPPLLVDPDPPPANVELSYAPSEYLQYLPPIYHRGENDLVNTLLLAYEGILKPIEQQINQIDGYFNPWVAPAALLPWLASWVDIVLDPTLPCERQRELISRAADIYRMRGTRRGLGEYLRIYTGATPTIIEPGEPGATHPPLGPNNFHVLIDVPDRAPADRQESAKQRAQRHEDLERRLRALIEAEKPAHTSYYLTLRFTPATPSAATGAH